MQHWQERWKSELQPGETHLAGEIGAIHNEIVPERVRKLRGNNPLWHPSGPSLSRVGGAKKTSTASSSALREGARRNSSKARPERAGARGGRPCSDELAAVPVSRFLESRNREPQLATSCPSLRLAALLTAHFVTRSAISAVCAG